MQLYFCTLQLNFIGLERGGRILYKSVNNGIPYRGCVWVSGPLPPTDAFLQLRGHIVGHPGTHVETEYLREFAV